MPLRTSLLAGCCAFAIAGCGSGSSSEVIASRESAQKAYDQAMGAMEQKNYPVAKPLFDQAIDSGYLYLDLLTSAYINRAVCSAAAGEFAAAHADLDAMKDAPVSGDKLLAARSFVLEKQGKSREARAAWSQARRINRFVQKYGE
mgnify:CR=1 FL=1